MTNLLAFAGRSIAIDLPAFVIKRNKSISFLHRAQKNINNLRYYTNGD